jgi:hypothetical protein
VVSVTSLPPYLRVKDRGKILRIADRKGTGEWRYKSIFSLASALCWSGQTAPRPDGITPWEIQPLRFLKDEGKGIS